MNARVLLLLIACVLTSGCCMPGMFMNPGMMQCCPVGGQGASPMMNPAATGPAQFRSFHDNIVTTRYQSPGTIGSTQRFPRLMSAFAARPRLPLQTACRPIYRPQAMPVCPQPACPQPVCVQAVCVQPVCVQPPVAYTPRYRVPTAPVHAKPWRLPWTWGGFPKFGSLLPKPTVPEMPTFQRWLPVVNDGLASAPCAETGCGEEGIPTLGTSYHFPNESCGEDIPYLGMTSQPTASLSPVPAPPMEADVRYFPNTGQQQVLPKPAPKKEQPEAYYFDPPPAAERLSDPSDVDLEEAAIPETTQADQQPADPEIPTMIVPPQEQGDVSPASKPAMPEAINPFEDIENAEPDASLPVEADMPQAILLVPKNIYPPLHIPAPKVVSLAASSEKATAFMRPVEAVSAQVSPTIEAVEIDWMQPVETLQTIRQVSANVGSVNPEMRWEAIELEQAFFRTEQPTRTHQNLRSTEVSQQRQVQRHTVVRRSVVEEAEEFVPIRRITTRRRQ